MCRCAISRRDVLQDGLKSPLRAVARAHTPFPPCGCDALTQRLLTQVEPNLVMQLFVRGEEVGLDPFLEQLLVIGGAFGKQEPAAGGNLE